MPSISQGLVLTTAMVFSSTAIYLAFHWHKNTLPFQFHANSNKPTLHSCLYSSIQKKRGVRNLRRKKKRVQFAENVMEPRKESEEMNKEQSNQNRASSKCSHETSENIRIPAKVKVHMLASSF